VHSVRKPWWQQATALVTVSTSGAITGFTFVPGAAAAMTSPASMPLHLLALEKAAKPAEPGDAGLRSAIVNVAGYYLRLAQTRTPAQMEALIWGKASVDGADHGPSCAAFASLTLELAAQAVGQQSWVSGGATYPWPLHPWADVRVDPNPASLSITSMVQDAQTHQRWHPVGDGYQPRPGDWVLFSQHVEVVSSYAGGVLDTIGADSLPNFTVNAHSFPGPLADQGVEGFVDNGHLGGAQPATAAQGTSAVDGTQRHQGTKAPQRTRPSSGTGSAHAATGADGASGAQGAGQAGLADIPGAPAPTTGPAIGATSLTGAAPATGAGSATGAATATGASSATGPSPVTQASGAAAPARPARHGPGADDRTRGGGVPRGTANIPGAQASAGQPASAARAASQSTGPAADPVTAAVTERPPSGPKAAPKAPYRKHSAPHRAATPGTSAQQAFINQIAPGAIAAQQRYGVPASVTIAQAIDESGWGGSALAANNHNLFGIKGSGPAGSVSLPTQEYLNGQWVTINAPFRVYYNIAESIADHAELLATSGYYQRAMADRAVPDAFANDLTGVYATDPEYGANLIALMRLYNLYRFDTPAVHQQAAAAGHPPAVHVPASQAATAHTPVGQAPIPGAMPEPAAVATTAPAVAAPATAVIPGSALFAGGTAVPGATAVPGSAVIPGDTAVPGAAQAPGAAQVPGTVPAHRSAPGRSSAPGGSSAARGPSVSRSAKVPHTRLAPGSTQARVGARIPGLIAPAAPQYRPQLPGAVATAFFASAKTPLARAEPLYRDVAEKTGIRWELLAACDWMQCQADPRYSPVHGEKIGALNSDGTVYQTKSEALAQCASDLIQLAGMVYRIDLAAPGLLSVRALADAFAAFRWGGLLKRHRVSAMEFPYSVAGLTAQHLKMHWPPIKDPDAPDRPGGRFRRPFGAVPVVLSLHYPATV
jgi:flagellum-specific peptidoglycan hydrolase FlgJ